MMNALRDFLYKKGANALSDAQLLALLLRLPSVEKAEEMLHLVGSLRGVFALSKEQLEQIKGLGEASWAQLVASQELLSRVLLEKTCEKPLLSNMEQVSDYLRFLLGNESIEVMMAFFLDCHHRLIAVEELSRGTVFEHSVYIREIVKRALDHYAVGLIIAHNHPSGSAQESENDRFFTVKLRAALKILDIQLVDHLIVTADTMTSFQDRGLLDF